MPKTALIDIEKMAKQLLADLEFFDTDKHQFVIELYLSNAYEHGSNLGWAEYQEQDMKFNSQGLPS